MAALNALFNKKKLALTRAKLAAWWEGANYDEAAALAAFDANVANENTDNGAEDELFDAPVYDLPPRLAALGVFEVALGGGEVVREDDLVATADRIRALGMVPNRTTSGFGVTDRVARRMAGRFGQVNVSVDGLGERYAAVRGWDGAAVGLRAIDRLVRAGVRVGVNTVLTRENVDGLEEMGRELAALGVTEWQWLRLKPAAWPNAPAPTPPQP